MNMIGLNKRDIKKALKAGAKAGGVSLADVRADIEAQIINHFITGNASGTCTILLQLPGLCRL